MAVASGVWTYLGAWGYVWVAVVIAGALALGILVVALLSRRTRHRLPGLPLYLDEADAIAICQTGGYGEVAKRAVKDITGANKDGALGKEGWWFKFGGSHTFTQESTYDVEATANKIISYVIQALENQDGIVDVDLAKGTIRGDKAWRKTRAHQLAMIGQEYVAVHGTFKVSSQTDKETVLTAPINTPRRADLRVTCDERSLRRDKVPKDEFSAWCLGKYVSWKEETGEIVIRPVALFQ
ncbi:hypothetical protein LWC34_49820 [Kibdelosporangium philippinense]|uniref:Uncharacterized protein n=1 Tax=Kibdelosporangium philippinense TaxID=211113 RepID=A0ABS8ZT21_9PSEU|nr:hypothetical protein [Kibdelosporangium philippinense]MCE7010851.1 hypothetical protein [Kibdelosporangium philippinense]